MGGEAGLAGGAEESEVAEVAGSWARCAGSMPAGRGRKGGQVRGIGGCRQGGARHQEYEGELPHALCLPHEAMTEAMRPCLPHAL